MRLIILAIACGSFVGSGCSPGNPAAPPPVASWAPPADSAIPDDSLGASIRRGLALLVDTRDSLPQYATSSLNCTSCHLDGGRRAGAAPLLGTPGRFPEYLARAGAVVPLEDRINYCMTRSLAGYPLPSRSREMLDIVAYLSFLSRGLPMGDKPDGLGFPAVAALHGDSVRGAELYGTACSACHGIEGQGGGVPRAPALWGSASYSIGASMARVERAAAFIKHNMPQTAPGSLTDQQAWDVAAYINGHPRPDMPGKEEDWPYGGAPEGVPYATPGRSPDETRVLLPRVNPEASVVPLPRALDRGSPSRR